MNRTNGWRYGIPPRTRTAAGAGRAAAVTATLATAWLVGLSPDVRAQAPATPAKATAKPATTAPAAPAAPAAVRGTAREIKWDELMPADWDPMKGMKSANFGMFSDSDPRAEALLKQMRDAWDNAPVNPAVDGQAIRIPGYVVPLEESAAGIKEFLLVPYFGACIHSPPPPANQIIHVLRPTAAKGLQSMDPVWVAGTLKVARSDTYMGVSGYRLEAVSVEPYTDTPPGGTGKAR